MPLDFEAEFARPLGAVCHLVEIGGIPGVNFLLARGQRLVSIPRHFGAYQNVFQYALSSSNGSTDASKLWSTGSTP